MNFGSAEGRNSKYQILAVSLSFYPCVSICFHTLMRNWPFCACTFDAIVAQIQSLQSMVAADGLAQRLCASKILMKSQ